VKENKVDIELLFLVETCLNTARYHGYLPYYIDVHAVMHGLCKHVFTWTAAQRAEASSWCERSLPPGTSPAPPHVDILVKLAQRPSRTEAA
jgi:hypothetical protein